MVADSDDKTRQGQQGTVFDPAFLDIADEVVAGLTDSYLEWAAADLASLRSLVEETRHADEVTRDGMIRRIFLAAHDIKGQGGSFGFPLITRVGDSLCRLVEAGGETAAMLDRVERHLDVLDRIIAARLAGEGGEDGAALLAALGLVVPKT